MPDRNVVVGAEHFLATCGACARCSACICKHRKCATSTNTEGLFLAFRSAKSPACAPSPRALIASSNRPDDRSRPRRDHADLSRSDGAEPPRQCHCRGTRAHTAQARAHAAIRPHPSELSKNGNFAGHHICPRCATKHRWGHRGCPRRAAGPFCYPSNGRLGDQKQIVDALLDHQNARPRRPRARENRRNSIERGHQRLILAKPDACDGR
jgi:hypothetical protein